MIRNRANGPSNPDRPLYLAGALLIVSMLAVSLHLALPVQRLETHAVWQPRGAETDAPLMLSARRPATLEAALPCAVPWAMAATDPAMTALTTSASPAMKTLSILVTHNRVWVSVGGTTLLAADIPSPGQADVSTCQVMTRYAASSNELVLSGGSGDNQSTVVLTTNPWEPGVERRGIEVTGLHVDPRTVPGITVDVVSMPAAVTSPWTRYIPGLVGLAAGIAVLVIVRTATRPDRRRRSPRGERRNGFRAWDRLDYSLLAVFTLSAVVVPPLYDDGWVLTTVRQYPSLGYFSDYFDHMAAPQPQGFWWDWLAQAWLRWTGLPAVALRIAAVVLCALCWVGIRRCVREISGRSGRPQAEEYVAAAVLALFAASWLVTLRPEPLVGLLLTIQIGVVVGLARRPSWDLVLGSGLLSVLALAAHQTGVVVLAASLAAVPAVFRLVYRRGTVGRGLLILAISAIALASLLALLLTAGGNLSMWLDARAAFSEGADHNQVLDEVARISFLDEVLITGMRRWTIVLLAVAAVGYAFGRSQLPTVEARAAGASALLAVAGLSLTVSKWPWHYGALAPAAAILFALVIAWLRQTESLATLTARSVVITTALVAGGYWAAQSREEWGHSSLAGISASDVTTTLSQGPLNTGAALAWIVLVVVGLMCAIVARRLGGLSPRRTVYVGSASTAALVGLVVVTTSLGPVVVDGFVGGPASWIAQTTAIFRGNTCGLGGSTGFAVPTTTAPVQTRPGPSDDAIELVPVGVDAPTSPASTATVLGRPADAVGGVRLATPWQAAEPGQSLRFWLWTNPGVLSVTIEEASLAGAVHVIPGEPTPTGAPAWRLVEVPVASQPRLVRLAWNSWESAATFATTAVRVVSTQSLEELADGPAWANANTFLYTPCLEAPSIATGMLQPVAWSSGIPELLGSSYIIEGTITEMACAGTTLKPGRLCATRVEVPESSVRMTVQVTTT